MHCNKSHGLGRHRGKGRSKRWKINHKPIDQVSVRLEKADGGKQRGKDPAKPRDENNLEKLGPSPLRRAARLSGRKSPYFGER